MAAEILGVGVSRIRLSPDATDRLADAITRDSIKALIKDGVIWVAPAKGISRGRRRARLEKIRKRGRGAGSKEGSKGARMSRKRLWILRVRALRRRLKALKARGVITGELFDKLYLQVKGGQIRNVRHLMEVVKEAGSR